MAGLGLSGPLAVDANCLSYLLLDSATPDRRQRMLAALDEARAYGLQYAAIAAAEILVEPVRRGDRSRFVRTAAVLGSNDFTCVPMALDVAQAAAEIRGTSTLKLPDAIVVASALGAGADVLLSNDREVVRVASQYLRAIYFDDWQP